MDCYECSVVCNDVLDVQIKSSVIRGQSSSPEEGCWVSFFKTDVSVVFVYNCSHILQSCQELRLVTTEVNLEEPQYAFLCHMTRLLNSLKPLSFEFVMIHLVPDTMSCGSAE